MFITVQESGYSFCGFSSKALMHVSIDVSKATPLIFVMIKELRPGFVDVVPGEIYQVQ